MNSKIKRLYVIPILCKALDILEQLEKFNAPVALDDLFHHRRACSVHRFIRIQHQNPAAGGVRDLAVTGGREVDSGEIEWDHLRSVFSRDAGRAIRRAGVDNDDLANQIAYRIEASGKIALLVLHDHAEAERARHGKQLLLRS